MLQCRIEHLVLFESVHYDLDMYRRGGSSPIISGEYTIVFEVDLITLTFYFNCMLQIKCI